MQDLKIFTEKVCDIEDERLAPLGTKIDEYLNNQLNDKVLYYMMRRAMATYLDDKPNFIKLYKLFVEYNCEGMMDVFERISDFVETKIVYVFLRIKEPIEEAVKKSHAITDLAREMIMRNFMDNFTIPDYYQNLLLNAVYNLTNYSGFAIAFGPDDQNETGSILHVYIFDF